MVGKVSSGRSTYKTGTELQLALGEAGDITHPSMTTELRPVAQQEQQAILDICILAAFADGLQDQMERERIQKIHSGFVSESPDATSVYQEVISGQLSMATAVSRLQ